MPGLVVDGLSAGYGGPPVLHDVSLTVEPGRVVSLLGANGAGKTTISRTVAGLLRPAAGTVTLDGADLTRRPVHRIVRDGLVTVPEGRRLFGRLSAEANLRLAFIAQPGDENRRLEEAFARFPELAPRRTQLVGTMSGGEQQMLAFAKALLLRPKVLVLDEPSTGLAPLIVERLLESVATLAAEVGCGVLLIEQNVAAALRVSDHGYVLERGRVVLDGPASELAEHESVRDAYLGGGRPTRASG